ncbi:MAG: 6,7-dimethyl-8-ribityllumazine synthase [Rickettsiales bacterium]|jgi:6,7-dimethyl-8-ribityllumazine synthase
MQKILIVQAPFYQKISNMLLEGAILKAKKNQLEYEIIDVLGAFEIPAAISIAAKSEKYDGYIALGCVIRGETTHYDYVCLESARGLNELGFKENLAIGYGIITCENEDQAIARADLNQKDKGGFAVEACFKMMELKKKFSA